ncbi:adhesion G protein-coupled receptor F5-like isoform X1 [Aquarana catesbeiana]|uniref:adhesion G protein-coupled receptor F5-like isoform X1 n=1 Tax=Aquarana catesbeiana TaxID=8400 RepID=UPI003CCA6894
MTALPSILYLFLCLSWQTSSGLSEENFQDLLAQNMLRLDDNTHISLQREKRAASQDMASYAVDIEISFSDAALATNYTNVLKNMDVYASLPNTIVISSVSSSGACTFNQTHANCSCSENSVCLGTPGPCVNGSCICITTLPLQQYCIPNSSKAFSPDPIFQGDTVTIYCAFSTSGSISWYFNSTTLISANQKYNTSFGLQGTMVQYTLMIGNVSDTDQGSYTCSLTSSGTPQNQTITISTIKTLQIYHLNGVIEKDSYCDGAAFTLTCCSADIGKFNVAWTPIDPSGTVTSEGSCSIYTLTPSISSCSSPTVNYICNFTRNEGATSSEIIKVNYIQRADISFTPSSSSYDISAGKILTIICNTNSPLSSIAWAKDTLTNIVNSSNTLFTSSASTAWSGTYFCIVSQGRLSTSASVSVNIVPLPRKEVISVFPLMTVITSCDPPTKLSCCVADPASSSYIIKFTNDNSPTRDLKTNCYFTYAECSTGSNTIVSCVVSNHLGDSVTSDNMIVSQVKASSGDCKADASQELPSSPSSSTYSVGCSTKNPNMLGTINYTCTNGIWSSPVSSCYSAAVLQQLVAVQDVLKGPAVQQDLPRLLQNISATATNQTANIASSSQTLQLMVNIISTVSSANVTVEPAVMQNFIKTVDVVVTASNAWSSNTNSNSVTILNSVEKFAENLNFNETIDFKNDSLNNIQLYGKVVTNDESYNKNFSLQNLTGNVFINGGTLTGNSTQIVTIAYGTMKDILPKNNTQVVNGLVMSTILGKNSSTNIDSSTFKINMSFTESIKSLENPECVWFDLTQNIWSSSGCTPSTVDNVIVCTCNHLTSFSILMGSSIQNEKFLEIITYIGVGISLACLVITLLIETLVWDSVIKNKTSYIRHVCLVNIAVTLLVADIWFIIGAALVENNKGSAACKAAAFFSFFFYLSLFFWMLTTGLILFYRMVYILHDMSRKTMMIIAFLLGYGCPLLITIITVASTEPSKRFISSKFCWLDYSDSRSFLAFVVPALTIVFVDILILVVVIFKLMRPTIGEQSGKEERKTLILIAKTMAILTPLLGTTWGFGLGVVIHPDNLVINGIFAALNSFQGLFILISTVLLDQKVRKAVRSSITSSYFRTLRSKGQTTSTDSSGTSKPKKRKNAFKTGFFGKRAVYNLYSTQDSTETSGNSYSVLT